MTLVIAAARVEDAAEIGVFQTTCWEQVYRGVVPDSYLDAVTPAMREVRWRGRISAGERRVIIARNGQGIVGVASTAATAAERPDLPSLGLCSIYVDRGSHGTGAGASLLVAAVADADVHLQVFSANARAQRFYAKHGFVATDECEPDSDTGLELQRWIRRRA